MLDATQFIIHLQSLIDNPFKKRFLLAVSGGVDSCVMAYLFHHHGLDFDVAHCNFHLRGEESDQDMEFLKNIPYLKDVSLFIKEFDTIALQQDSGKSVEMVARDLRYEWFQELGKEYDYIATAHHADDNAETIFLNLTRGTGLKGMTGIPSINGKIIRPLLPFPAEDILAFAAQHHIEFRIDQSNYSELFRRNKIRWQIIPKLKEINPNLIPTFTRNIGLFNAQYRFYQQKLQILKTGLLLKKDNEYLIPIQQLIDSGHSELLLHEILTDFNFHSDTIQNIVNKLHTIPGKKFTSGTHSLIKDRKYLIISEIKTTNPLYIIIDHLSDLENLGFSVETLDYKEDLQFQSDPNTIYIDKNKVQFPLILRNWQEGDYFYPYGMKGKKKVSDLFTDEKIAIPHKHRIPLLCMGESIIWIVGYKADRRFAIKSGETTQYYVIRRIAE